VLTVGVEEEFLLLEPDGAVAPVAADVVGRAGGDGLVKTELMAFQVETATPVCGGLTELRAELVRLRLRVASAARQAGALLVSAGMPPYQAGPLDLVTSEPRYLRLAGRYPWAAAVGCACACQVHIGLEDRELRADVVARLRPWLTALLALTGNSPVTAGTDSGWSSRRYRAMLHWPTFRPPGPWADLGTYDRAVEAAIASGAAADPASVYFLARLSPRYPTIEVRIADAALTPSDAVLLAAVVRGLVTALAEDARRGSWIEPLPERRIGADLLSAARYATLRLDRQGRRGRATAGELVAALHAKILPAVRASGDAELVGRGLERLRRTGTGADRQRALLARAPAPRAFVAALAEATAPIATG
jgi:glutamate---cysteine ligase / carboxylate-amine ligase